MENQETSKTKSQEHSDSNLLLHGIGEFIISELPVLVPGTIYLSDKGNFELARLNRKTQKPVFTRVIELTNSSGIKFNTLRNHIYYDRQGKAYLSKLEVDPPKEYVVNQIKKALILAAREFCNGRSNDKSFYTIKDWEAEAEFLNKSKKPSVKNKFRSKFKIWAKINKISKKATLGVLDKIPTEYVRYYWKNINTITDWEKALSSTKTDKAKKKSCEKAFVRWLKLQDISTIDVAKVEHIYKLTGRRKFTRATKYRKISDWYREAKQTDPDSKNKHNFRSEFIKWVKNQTKLGIAIDESDINKVLSHFKGYHFEFKPKSLKTIKDWFEYTNKLFKSGKSIKYYKIKRQRDAFERFKSNIDLTSLSKREKVMFENTENLLTQNKVIKKWEKRKTYTLNDWKEEYLSHPEWHYLTREYFKGNVYNFYSNLVRWAKIQSSNQREIKNIIREVMPTNFGSWAYEFNGKVSRFDSQHERLIAVILFNLGLVKDFEEGINLHVKTNTKSRHSIDFLIGNVFLEYHPISAREMSQELSEQEIYRNRKNHITKPEYKNIKLIFFSGLDKLGKSLRKLLKELNLPYENIDISSLMTKAKKDCDKYDSQIKFSYIPSPNSIRNIVIRKIIKHSKIYGKLPSSSQYNSYSVNFRNNNIKPPKYTEILDEIFKKNLIPRRLFIESGINPDLLFASIDKSESYTDNKGKKWISVKGIHKQFNISKNVFMKYLANNVRLIVGKSKYKKTRLYSVEDILVASVL